MSYDTVLNKNFKSVSYPFNADKQSINPPKITPLKSVMPEATSENKVKPFNDAKTSDTKTSDTTEKKSNDVTLPKPALSVSAVETVKPDVIQMPDISFIPQKWSRDLILYENNKPAILKTYNFQYKDKKFPGIVTDNTGKIYLYDRANEFHRPLKHLIRSGDDLSGYHAGFQEEQRKKNSHYFIDLGSLEVLQAALRSSISGKYTVAIKEDDSFMTNWMRATSLDETEKFRYLNDNSVRLHSKATRNFYPLWLALGASLMLIPTTLMTISLVNEGDLTPLDKNVNAPPLSNAGEKALIGTMPALGGVGLGIVGTTLYKNRNNIFVSEVNENLKLPENQYVDTLVSKPR